jgi:hypothetical protein
MRRSHVVIGPHTLKGGNLTFRTGNTALTFDARHAMATSQSFGVAITRSTGFKEVTGKVLSEKQVEDAKPPQWEIMMKVSP